MNRKQKKLRYIRAKNAYRKHFPCTDKNGTVTLGNSVLTMHEFCKKGYIIHGRAGE